MNNCIFELGTVEIGYGELQGRVTGQKTDSSDGFFFFVR